MSTKQGKRTRTRALKARARTAHRTASSDRYARAATRAALIELLQTRLAGAIDLSLQAKHAHWNVRGAQFIALHELFDRVAEQVRAHADLLAERIAQLGGVADGSLRTVARHSTLRASVLGHVEGAVYVRALAASLARFAQLVVVAIERADELEDPVTADLLTEVARGADELGWLLAAHERVDEVRR
jgi:starvation-inducible DNA-binding protein